MIKRTIDIIGAATALLILLPLIVVLGLIVYWKIGRPIIFVQERPGRNGKLFKFYKYRTMTNVIDENGKLLSDNFRITKLGKILRNTSLDELPSFWNVLKGDMSLVGPRPLLLEYLPLYSVEQARRHNVKPGITGWAQINGRNKLTWEEKFRLDVWYVDNYTVICDLKIIAITIGKVLNKENVNASNSTTMERFGGN
jgi:sugar transferase EpsL